MEIATAKIKIKDHKEEITKIIDDTYLRSSYEVKKISDGVYEGHAGILGVFAVDILDKIKSKNLISSVESFEVSELVNNVLETDDYLEGYENGYK